MRGSEITIKCFNFNKIININKKFHFIMKLEQQTRRVLRARGISSYTEQLYSDDEIEENELEEWTDVEAVYAAPSTQTGPSTSYLTPKVRYSDDRTNEEEDSDQDWILPSSRKRKNKRPC